MPNSRIEILDLFNKLRDKIRFLGIDSKVIWGFNVDWFWKDCGNDFGIDFGIDVGH